MPAEKVPELIAGITTADEQVINKSIEVLFNCCDMFLWHF